jgi:chlorophyll synthase
MSASKSDAMNKAIWADARAGRPSARAILQLLKPITWFPPMWAYMCGVVSSGAPMQDRWGAAVAGIILAGPLVCATSQAVNDWFDRHVDAINEPHRPIPSGRVPGAWGLYLACAWTLLSLVVAAMLGGWVLAAALLGLALAWAYSAPPLRLKRNGWWGNTAVGLCYEGLPWITGAAVMSAAMPDVKIWIVAALYSLGAHGIMTLNDFKSMEGDRRMGVASLPVQLGERLAAQTACLFMALPQAVVAALLLAWGHPAQSLAVAMLLAAQLLMMIRFMADPRNRALWLSAFGVNFFVLGMLISAVALRAGVTAPA